MRSCVVSFHGSPRYRTAVLEECPRQDSETAGGAVSAADQFFRKTKVVPRLDSDALWQSFLSKGVFLSYRKLRFHTIKKAPRGCALGARVDGCRSKRASARECAKAHSFSFAGFLIFSLGVPKPYSGKNENGGNNEQGTGKNL